MECFLMLLTIGVYLLSAVVFYCLNCFLKQFQVKTATKESTDVKKVIQEVDQKLCLSTRVEQVNLLAAKSEIHQSDEVICSWKRKPLVARNFGSRSWPSKLQRDYKIKKQAMLQTIFSENSGVKQEGTTSKWTMDNLKFSEKFFTGAVVRMSFIWDMSTLNLTAAADDENLDNLQDEIREFVLTAPGMTRTPQLNEIVIAPYVESYYRARVSDIKGNDISVIFIDYGDKTVLKVWDVKEPSDAIMKHPVYGICMQMIRVPLGVPLIETPVINEISRSEGQINIISRDDPALWVGELWIASDKTWSELANEAIKGKGVGRRGYGELPVATSLRHSGLARSQSLPNLKGTQNHHSNPHEIKTGFVPKGAHNLVAFEKEYNIHHPDPTFVKTDNRQDSDEDRGKDNAPARAVPPEPPKPGIELGSVVTIIVIIIMIFAIIFFFTIVFFQ